MNFIHVCLVFCLTYFHSPYPGSGQQVTDNATAEHAPKTVLATGHIDLLDPSPVKNRTDHDATIIWLLPNHSIVKQGDLVAELDDSRLRDRLAEKTILLENAESQLSEVQSRIANLQSDFDANLAVGNLELDVAVLNQQRFLGEGGKLERNLDQLQQRMELAKLRHERLKRRWDEGKGQDDNLQLDIEVQEAAVAVKALEQEIEYSNGPERTYLTALHTLEVKRSKTRLSQLQRQFETDRVALEAKLESASRELELEHDEFEYIESQIEMCKIHAPNDGMLVHQTVVTSEFDEGILVEEGLSVRPWQNIAVVGDTSQLCIRALVDEADLSQVTVGQEVFLQLEDRLIYAVPVAKVMEIAEMPYPGSWRTGERKYPITVSHNRSLGVHKLGTPVRIIIKAPGKQLLDE